MYFFYYFFLFHFFIKKWFLGLLLLIWFELDFIYWLSRIRIWLILIEWINFSFYLHEIELLSLEIF